MQGVYHFGGGKRWHVRTESQPSIYHNHWIRWYRNLINLYTKNLFLLSYFILFVKLHYQLILLCDQSDLILFCLLNYIINLFLLCDQSDLILFCLLNYIINLFLLCNQSVTLLDFTYTSYFDILCNLSLGRGIYVRKKHNGHACWIPRTLRLLLSESIDYDWSHH